MFDDYTFPSSRSGIIGLVGDWQERLLFMDADFQHKELILALRTSSLHALLKYSIQQLTQSPSPSLPSHTQLNSLSSALFNALNSSLITQTQLAREAGRFQVRTMVLWSSVYWLVYIGRWRGIIWAEATQRTAQFLWSTIVTSYWWSPLQYCLASVA